VDEFIFIIKTNTVVWTGSPSDWSITVTKGAISDTVTVSVIGPLFTIGGIMVQYFLINTVAGDFKTIVESIGTYTLYINHV
jgi:hypothetical protein